MSRSHSNTVVSIALDVPSIRSQILVRKLCFLAKMLNKEEDLHHHSLGKNLFTALAMKDIYNIALVSQCMYVEEGIGSDYTAKCLNDPSNAIAISKVCSEDIYNRSRQSSLQKARNHNLALRDLVKVHDRCPWIKIWDWALDFGVKGTKTCQLILRLLTRRIFKDSVCDKCDQKFSENDTYLGHALSGCCSRFAVPPFTTSELCDSVGTETSFMYSSILRKHF